MMTVDSFVVMDELLLSGLSRIVLELNNKCSFHFNSVSFVYGIDF